MGEDLAQDQAERFQMGPGPIAEAEASFGMAKTALRFGEAVMNMEGKSKFEGQANQDGMAAFEKALMQGGSEYSVEKDGQTLLTEAGAKKLKDMVERMLAKLTMQLTKVGEAHKGISLVAVVATQ